MLSSVATLLVGICSCSIALDQKKIWPKKIIKLIKRSKQTVSVKENEIKKNRNIEEESDEQTETSVEDESVDDKIFRVLILNR